MTLSITASLPRDIPYTKTETVSSATGLRDHIAVQDYLDIMSVSVMSVSVDCTVITSVCNSRMCYRRYGVCDHRAQCITMETVMFHF